MNGCPFCAIVEGTAPAEVVAEWPDAIAIVPLDPVTPGHVLVIPRVHVGNATLVPAITADVMHRAAQLARPPAVQPDHQLRRRGHADDQAPARSRGATPRR